MMFSNSRLNTVGALAIVVIGLVATAVVLWNRVQVAPSDTAPSGEAVTAVELQPQLASPRIEAHGTVVPARKVTIRPQVEGLVRRRHPGLVAGGVVQRGETILELDPRDYQLAVEEMRVQVELAEAELAIEQGRQVVAEQEWQRFGEQDEEPSPLALRKPQQQQAKLEISRAEQRLEQVKLDLARTKLTAPFTALVQHASVEPGDLVSPSTEAASLVALDEFWVQVSVPLDALSRIAIPGRDGDEGSRAFIRHYSGAETVEHKGEVIRLLGDLDTASGMARVLVRVEDPFSLSGDEGEQAAPDTPALRKAPLLLGSVVTVELQGPEPQEIMEVPRQALHEGNRIYVATADDTLAIREIDIAWRNSTTVAINDRLEEGERLILTGMVAPVEGMPLRVETPPDEPSLAQEDSQ